MAHHYGYDDEMYVWIYTPTGESSPTEGDDVSVELQCAYEADAYEIVDCTVEQIVQVYASDDGVDTACYVRRRR